MAVQMQVRRGTAAAWTAANPTLASGEWGFETDTGKVKIGDGATAWASLAYTGGGAPTGAAGGDLGGTYPNPTVNDNSHAHDSTTVTTHSTAHSHASLTGVGANDHHAQDHASRHGSAGADPVKLGSLYIPAGALTPSTTNGASGAQLVESTTNKVNQWLMDFADAVTSYAEAEILMPSDWDGGTFTAKFVWQAAGVSTNSVVWQIDARSYGDSETIDQAFGTAQTVTDAHTATASQNLISGATGAVTAGGTPAAGELLHIRVARLGGNGSDTLAATARLSGVHITYNRS